MAKPWLVAVIVMVVEFTLCIQLARSIGTTAAVIFCMTLVTGVIIVCTGMIIKAVKELRTKG